MVRQLLQDPGRSVPALHTPPLALRDACKPENFNPRSDGLRTWCGKGGPDGQDFRKPVPDLGDRLGPRRLDYVVSRHGLCAAIRYAERCPSAVSYTHLRAHETP